MALSTYSELQDAISAWLDGSDFSGRETDFIALCEDEINARLAAGIDAGHMIRPMVTRGDLTINSEYEDLPDSEIVVPITIEVTSHSVPWMVDYLAPDDFLQLKVEIGESVDTSVPPSRFTVLGDELRFWPVPASAWTAQFVRFDRVPALSDDAPTNWVLTSHRNAYLYGSLAQAEMFGWKDDRMANCATLFANACDGIIARYPMQASMAALRSETALLGRGGRMSLSSFMSGDF